MRKRSCLIIVLAAGEGSRMRARRPKALHALAGRSLLAHVLTTAAAISPHIALVVGPGHNELVAEARRHVARVAFHVQTRRRGTAHAVRMARDAIARGYDDILVVFADTPLVTARTLARLRHVLAEGAAVAVLGFEARDPRGYGRLIVENDTLIAIREEKDASAAESAITLCNGGIMALRGEHALRILDRIGNANAKREYYLTDAVAIARGHGLDARALAADEDELRGVNTQAQLAFAEGVLQARLRAAALDAGVCMVAPPTVFLSFDTVFGRDVTIEPFVVLGPGVIVDDGAVIRSFSHLEGTRVGSNNRIGPFARLRPGARLGAEVRIGNFVEVKNSRIEAKAQANHLAYIGDASVGPATNIGAGTVTCNYDGREKHETKIGAKVFIGSNSALVAPVSIGDGAYVGSGSVVTHDVPANALVIARARQVIKEDWTAAPARKSLPRQRAKTARPSRKK
ncbi:MAG: bifunctional UDP-N-acetylglucosamine diphosphorylase/glucosamine-1-phosphate N-acetyltransferase GlmU [Proteobacteria bacterium]|nr:bifunctional UDP-N-acetylglucosamine diphosphorylase/glucosamine-1-phosphate N-acetyltransferase GlmU [Pseudomonadota bacterium]